MARPTVIEVRFKLAGYTAAKSGCIATDLCRFGCRMQTLFRALAGFERYSSRDSADARVSGLCPVHQLCLSPPQQEPARSHARITPSALSILNRHPLAARSDQGAPRLLGIEAARDHVFAGQRRHMQQRGREKDGAEAERLAHPKDVVGRRRAWPREADGA